MSLVKNGFQSHIKMLRMKNNNECFMMDDADWENARHIPWFWHKGRVVNAQLVSFEDYVGIVGVRMLDRVEKYDYRRTAYNMLPNGNITA